MDEFLNLKLSEAAQMCAKDKSFAEQYFGFYQKRMRSLEPYVGACLHLPKEHSNFGVPFFVKDNIAIEDWPLTCASRLLENFYSPYTSTAVDRLLRSSCVVAAKTNLDEFAMGSSTEWSALKKTVNPWDVQRVPGGSSGGSAACVAARMVPFSLGSDTGGSIRQPASFCGVTGFKPSYGRVSRYGLVSHASSLDQIGPFARTAEDCAWVVEQMQGVDPLDSTSRADMSSALMPSSSDNAEGRLLYPRLWVEKLEQNSRDSFYSTLKIFEDLGYEILIYDDLALWEHALEIYYILAPAEASSNLARFDGFRYGSSEHLDGLSAQEVSQRARSLGFGPEVKRRILLGTFVLSSGFADKYYHKAQQARSALIKQFDKALGPKDCFILPTTPEPAFLAGSKTSEPLSLYLSDIFTVACNLVCGPGISIPGPQVSGLPYGVQLLAKQGQDKQLLQKAHHFQRYSSFHHEKSPLVEQWLVR